ncbi:MAG: RNA polymerase sigma factor [Saprospiraceae bacterium]
MTFSLQNTGSTHLATSRVRLESSTPSITLPQNMTDDALITRCIANDRLAQRALYERYTNRLYSVAIRYVRHAETAQDVLAEAWIKIFKNLSKFKHSGSFEGWMKRIVSNEALMHLRKNRISVAELSAAVMAQEPSDVRVTDGLENADVLRLLDTLPDGCRTVFNLYELEGFKHREIAEKLGVSINTSKSQLILAKQKLREAYLVLSQEEGRNLRPTPNQTKS